MSEALGWNESVECSSPMGCGEARGENYVEPPPTLEMNDVRAEGDQQEWPATCADPSSVGGDLRDRMTTPDREKKRSSAYRQIGRAGQRRSKAPVRRGEAAACTR